MTADWSGQQEGDVMTKWCHPRQSRKPRLTIDRVPSTIERAMKTLQVSQATVAQAGGVLDAIFRGDGGQFFIELETRTTGTAVLGSSNDWRPRAFHKPIRALEVIRAFGFQNKRFALETWQADESERERAHPIARKP